MIVTLHNVTSASLPPSVIYVNEDLIGGIKPTLSYRGTKLIHEVYLRETKPYGNNPFAEILKVTESPAEIFVQMRDYNLLTAKQKEEVIIPKSK